MFQVTWQFVDEIVLQFVFLRLQDDSSQEERLAKWDEISNNTVRIIVDGRAKLSVIKSKDPQSIAEIREQLDEAEVSHGAIWFWNIVHETTSFWLLIRIPPNLCKRVNSFEATKIRYQSILVENKSNQFYYSQCLESGYPPAEPRISVQLWEVSD